ncbi:MAG: Secretory immunoglobulin A-binding protein EsiB [Chlamydiae bacterium]|nr:Secretory immunoglobulin A-binding protein EsiB [Chlamydiota bacterium]
MGEIGTFDLGYIETCMPEEASFGETVANKMDNWIQWIASTYFLSCEYKILSEPEKNKYVFTRANPTLTSRITQVTSLAAGALALWVFGDTQGVALGAVVLITAKFFSNYLMKEALEIVPDAKPILDGKIEKKEEIERLANQEDRETQYNLGLCYYKGREVEQSFDKAADYFRRSANQGYAKAQTNLGFCYSSGKGVQKSEKEAIRLYHLAAEQKNIQAEYNLGLFHYKKKNFGQAFKWFEKAANQGDSDAQYMLAICYYKARGTNQNYVKSEEWFRKAASNDHTEAQYMLGIIHAKGKGMKINLIEAKKWLQRAADAGHDGAKIALQKLMPKARLR